MSSSKKICVVGGGVLGLSLSYYLAKDGYDVTLIEKANDWGGLASGISYKNYSIEKYYHHWFKSDEHIQELIKELGLEDKLVWLPSTVGVFQGGRLYDFSTSFSLLQFPLLGIWDRLRLGLVSLYLGKIKNYTKLQSIKAIDWCYSNFGEKPTKVIWKPLLKGKFGEYYDQISMSWLWARIHDRSSSRPNLTSKEYLGYLDGGFQVLIDRLVEECHKLKVNMISGATITGHSFDNAHHIQLQDKSGISLSFAFDKVVATVPNPVFTKIFDVPEQYSKKLKNINYIGATNLILILKKSLIPYYWLNISEAEYPFLVVVEHTNFVDKKNYDNDVIVYIAKYTNTNNKLFKMSEEEIIDYYLPYLQKINPALEKDWITDSFFFKSGFAQHIVTTDHEIPPYQTGVPGLFMANFSQIYPHDRGTNYAIEQAQQVYNLIKEE